VFIAMMKYTQNQVAFSLPKPSTCSSRKDIGETTLAPLGLSLFHGENLEGKTDPESFSELAHRYSLLLDRVVEQRFHRGASPHTGELSELSELLGQLQAGAREVVELHGRVMEKKLAAASAGMQQAYLEEGHLLVLELMGHLLSYYRRAYLHSKKKSDWNGDVVSAPYAANSPRTMDR
jgi:hypothetical protein